MDYLFIALTIVYKCGIVLVVDIVSVIIVIVIDEWLMSENDHHPSSKLILKQTNFSVNIADELRGKC